ncbi:MAG: SLC13 family permease [Bacteroidetes bacterium]|nr:MAG: SLC13 family permease [Bacteroidota bacterium]REK00942.1 MAG: SLC13 family permease [Bacteroidota bacterium]REK34545.1 MAG: SLC13 family permease [Bacteroidota bacterium]REK51804.1 MAG: SLC13 family permease [Bacteroidota bacterium]
MNADVIITLAVILLAVILFFTEVIAVELTAMIVMGLLIVSGVITPEEGVSGFSNPATVTVGAMFVLSAGLFRTGALNFVGLMLFRAHGKSDWLFLILLTFMAGAMSAFINDTAVVALLMPVVLKVARQTKISPSKLLMPLSFSALFGGVCTLIGTSTNLLVSSIAATRGQEEFSMFEMAPFGLVVFVSGTIYMIIAAKKWIPDRGQDKDLTEEFGMGEYLTEIVLLEDSVSIGSTIGNAPLVRELDIDIIEIRKKDSNLVLRFPGSDTVLEEGDVLRIRGDAGKIQELQERQGIRLKSDIQLHDKDMQQGKNKLVEAVISPSSDLVGTTIKKIDFRNSYGSTVLAIKQREEILHEKLGHVKLNAGDALLISCSESTLRRLKESQDFVIISDPGLPSFRKNKILIAFIIVFSVVLMAASGILSILPGSILGCIMLIITKCIKIEECYKAVEWKVIFLLAGVLSMGVALERSGAATLISDLMISTVGQLGNRALVSAFFLLTLIFTNFMSNNATAALLAPIAIITAEALGLSARPFLMAVTFAASLSLITPVGYQTNTMIYVPGRYRFTDFTRIGLPLDIIFWILATILIPIMYPF